MSNKQNIQETLVSVGFQKNYIVRAFKVYEKNYGHSYNIEVITEIISRLQNKDKAKKKRNAEPPPKPCCGPNYGQSQTHNIPNLSTMNRSSSGIKSKRKPNKPPPTSPRRITRSMTKKQRHITTQSFNYKLSKKRKRSSLSDTESESNTNNPINPLPSQTHASYNGNMNMSQNNNMNNKHIKSQSQSQSSQYKPPRPSPSAPPIFKPKEIVLYAGIEAEINYIRQNGLIAITYPSNVYITKRTKATVHSQQIHKLIRSSRKRQSAIDVNRNQNRKRKFDDMNEIELEPSLKKIKLMDIDNDFIDYKKENEILKKEQETLKQENKILKQRLDSLECKSEKIKAMNLNELNELKIRMQNKIKLIEESEKELIDNTYKCVACMDHAKNVSFTDGCSHVALCDKCEQSMENKSCPICKTPYTKVKKINF